MSNTKSTDPVKQPSAIESEIENINNQLLRIEKAVAVAIESFRRFDRAANSLNPDDYFRNQPQCESTTGCGEEKHPSEPMIKSGLILKLEELGAYAKTIGQQVASFNDYQIIPTACFFERNI